MFRITTYKQIVSCAVGLSALAAVGLVNAATVSLTPSPQTIIVGNTFNITASGTGFDADVTFLDMTLTWDTAFLELITNDPTTLISNAALLGFSTGGLTEVTYTPGVLNLSFDTPLSGFGVTTTPSGIFDFFTLEFLAVSSTIGTTLTAADGGLGGWGDGLLSPIFVDYANAEITINPVSAVPVPAAVWLFGSGLLGLVGVARRSTTTAVAA